jgi:hypothetical protein
MTKDGMRTRQTTHQFDYFYLFIRWKKGLKRTATVAHRELRIL